MSSATESSLPTEIVTTYPSSPPFTTRKPSPEEVLFEMNGDPAPKDEQPASEHLNSQASQAAHQRTDSGDTERPPSGQQNHESIDDDMQENTAEEQDGDDSDPADMIEEFDWNDLIQRYHAAMNKCTDEEAHLMQEWSNLMDYFQIWAESGHAHESDRSFRRLVTRSEFVQNEEDKLEKTRAHYVNVVKAFESALNLLQAHGFGA